MTDGGTCQHPRCPLPSPTLSLSKHVKVILATELGVCVSVCVCVWYIKRFVWKIKNKWNGNFNLMVNVSFSYVSPTTFISYQIHKSKMCEMWVRQLRSMYIYMYHIHLIYIHIYLKVKIPLRIQFQALGLLWVRMSFKVKWFRRIAIKYINTIFKTFSLYVYVYLYIHVLNYILYKNQVQLLRHSRQKPT